MIKKIPDNWRAVDLFGASKIQKLVGVYELFIPGLIRFVEIKIVDQGNCFAAYPNAVKKDKDGYPDGTCGFGKSELEALQDAIYYLMTDLSNITDLSDEKVVFRDEENIFELIGFSRKRKKCNKKAVKLKRKKGIFSK